MKGKMVNKMTFHDDEIDNFLKEKLNLLEQNQPRDLERTRQSRSEYIKQAKYLQFSKPIFSLVGLLQRKPWKAIFSQRPALLPFAAAFLLIFSFVFGSWGTVYAAQGSLPNDLLYSVKLTGENLQLAFTTKTEARISLLTALTDRRVEEATALISQGQPVPAKLSHMMDEHLDELFVLTASMDEAAQEEALKGIQVHLRDQDQDMTNAMKGLPEGLDPELVQLREMLKERQQLTQMGLGEPNIFQQQLRHQHGKPTDPITGTITTTVTTTPTITTTPEITVTATITPGQHGPGPCEIPGACTPAGDTHGPGPFEGTPPVDDDHEGYGPGSDEGTGPQQPPVTPKPDDSEKPKATPVPGGDDNGKDSGSDNNSGEDGSESDKEKEDSGDKKGKP